jgi:hypothetical protein
MSESQPIGIITEDIGEFKIKPNRSLVIDNKAERWSVVEKIIIDRVPGRNNVIRVKLQMPQPDLVEVRELSPSLLGDPMKPVSEVVDEDLAAD